MVVPISTRNSAHAILRFMDAPDLHPELTSRLGAPTTCFAAGERKNDQTQESWKVSLWAVESPVSALDNIEAHLDWAAQLVMPHQSYLHTLVSSGVNVSLHLAIHSDADFTLFTLKPQLLVPFATLGIPLEICTYMAD